MTKKKLIKLNGRMAKNESEVRAYQFIQELIPKSMKIVYEEEDIPYVIESNYKPDFRISTKKNDKTVAYLEYKGGGRAFDGNVRRKMIAVRDQHPDKKFYIIFHRDFKVGSKRKDGSFMKASDWATRHGFEFCIGYDKIPMEWFD